MSYRFPKTLPRANEVLDAIDMTENFQYVANEANGRLNQHNFAYEAFNSSLHLNPSAFARMRTMQVEVVSTAPHTAQTNAAEVIRSTWQPVGGESGVTRMLMDWTATDFAAVTLFASFQFSGPGETVGPWPPEIEDAGVNFALSYDGRVIPESCSGIMDLHANLLDSSIYGSHGYYPSGLARPVVVSATFAVTPGPHTFELVAQAQWSDEGTASRWIRRVYNREFVLIEWCKTREM